MKNPPSPKQTNQPTQKSPKYLGQLKYLLKSVLNLLPLSRTWTNMHNDNYTGFCVVKRVVRCIAWVTSNEVFEPTPLFSLKMIWVPNLVTPGGTVPSWFTSRPLERSFLLFGDLVLPALEFVSISLEWQRHWVVSSVKGCWTISVLLWSENVLAKKRNI